MKKTVNKAKTRKNKTNTQYLVVDYNSTWSAEESIFDNLEDVKREIEFSVDPEDIEVYELGRKLTIKIGNIEII